jgi:Cellulase (glycosyl hydrolase family 5)/Putative Ig domain
MDRASFFSRTPLRQLLVGGFSGIALWSAVAHATSDGLAISGNGYAMIIAGHPYSFTPTTKDPSRRKLVFSIANKPAWASFSSSTGRLWGTPSIAYSPRWFAGIKISVRDGVSTAALPQFGISVKRPGSSPPVISGTPPTGVNVGTPYSFRPAAKDPDGNPIWFGVTNKPSWASFNSTTGQLSGTPTAANVGTYSSIVIRVTDGQMSASLRAFSIQVKGTTTSNNPTLSLIASPTTVSSGSASMLSWSSTHATSCTASGGWSGSKAMSGTASTGVLSSAKTYTLTCRGASGTTPASHSITVTVGSGTRVARPPYNTGHGLFVLNGKLYDSNGIEFRIRGVNLCHFDSTPRSAPGIARSNANAVRIGLYLSSVATSTYVNTVQTYISDREIAIPTMFVVPGTSRGLSGSHSTADLAAAVSNWVTNLPYYAPQQQHLIINVANEWGPANSATWASAYESAIARLRGAGYSTPIMIDTGSWGEDFDDLLNYATQVFNSDPQKNIIFSLHLYYNASSALAQNILPRLAALSTAHGMVFVVGEFGPGRNIGPAPTLVTPQQVIGAAEAAGMGWMGWAWDDNNLANGASSNNWFSMTLHGPGIYNAPSDLTTYGQEMVLSNYALVRARKATDF